MTPMTTVGTGRRRPLGGGARWRGALAGLTPAGVIAMLFALTPDSPATLDERLTSLAWVALIAMSAGWIAGPLAVARPGNLARAALGYAIAAIAGYAALSIVQSAGDAVAAEGLDPVAIGTAIVGRAGYAVAATAYLIIPAVALGVVWCLTARILDRVSRRA